MKKFVFGALVLACTMFASCNRVSQEQYQQVTNSNDSLMLVALQQGNEIYDLNTTLKSVTEQLDQINGQISVSNGEDDDLMAQRERLMQKLQLVQQTINEKEQALQELQQKYSSQLSQNKELKKTIDRLQNEVKEYEASIESYRNQVVQMGQQINELNTNLTQTRTVLVETQQKAEQQETVINEQDKMLNTGYYIVADKKELKRMGIVEGGAFSKKRLTTQGFSTQDFNEVDIREFTELAIGSKNAKILSSHPTNSYELYVHADKTLKLIIKDPAAFWSNSKYLVVMN